MRRACLLAFVVLCAGCGGTGGGAEPAAPRASRFAGAEVEAPKRAPEIALRDQDGARTRLSDHRGRYVILTFLYTHCPDVCPLIATNLNTALRRLGPLRERVRVLAVSVDPGGDTPAAVRMYARRLRLLPEFLYLTGTRPQLRRVWRDYGVLAVARDPALVDHATYSVMVDPDGKRRLLYGAHVEAADVVHDIRLLSSGDPPR